MCYWKSEQEWMMSFTREEAVKISSSELWQETVVNVKYKNVNREKEIPITWQFLQCVGTKVVKNVGLVRHWIFGPAMAADDCSYHLWRRSDLAKKRFNATSVIDKTGITRLQYRQLQNGEIEMLSWYCRDCTMAIDKTQVRYNLYNNYFSMANPDFSFELYLHSGVTSGSWVGVQIMDFWGGELLNEAIFEIWLATIWYGSTPAPFPQLPQ